MKMELLAPAGSFEIAKSALDYGSDAVYLGGKKFGARALAENLSEEELIEITKYAHSLDKKVYVTINTVIFEDEFEECIKYLDFLYLNDIDGVIVQDLGLAMVIKKRYPGLKLHASTQMNIHTLEDVKALKKLGYDRVVLSRETPIEVIKEIKENVDIELEIFVHGALCVSYSGNCYLSSLIGKRSGNRGRCAQPCRLEYDLEENDKIINKGCLISPKELSTISYIDEYKKIGIESLKIEGRLKRKEYVLLAVSSYRKAIDKKNFVLNKEIDNLKIAYNRGFTKGFIFNESNNYFSNLSFQNHQGLLIGKVVSTYKDKVNIKLTHNLSINDSIRIVGKKTDGVVVNQMYVKNNLVKNAYPNDIVTIKVHEDGLGDSNVYLTSSEARLNEIINDKKEIKIPIKGLFYNKGDKIYLKFTDYKNECEYEIGQFDEANQDYSDRIKEQLSKLGGTIFSLKELIIASPNYNIPKSELNEARRVLVNNLLEKRSISYPNRRINKEIYDGIKIPKTNDLLVKVSNEEALIVALKYDVKIFVEDKKLYNKYKENENVYLATPRVFNNEINRDVLTENLSSVNGSYSSVYLNICNSYSLYQLYLLGSKCVGLSIEASGDRISDLIKAFENRFDEKPNVFVMVYGYYEAMISKYCPIQKIKGIEGKNCNQCLKNKYYLVDRMGYHFRLTKGEGCYTKILNSKRVHLINKLNELKELGVNNFLLDFTVEEKDEIELIIKMYIDALNGKDNDIRLSDVTYGHYNEGVL